MIECPDIATLIREGCVFTFGITCVVLLCVVIQYVVPDILSLASDAWTHLSNRRKQ